MQYGFLLSEAEKTIHGRKGNKMCWVLISMVGTAVSSLMQCFTAKEERESPK